MKAFKWIVASAVLCISSTLIAGESNGVIVSHYEPLQRLSMQTDNTALSQELQLSEPMSMGFDALGRTFEFELEPYNGFLSEETRNALPDDFGIYHGQLAGNPDSWTRIVIYDGAPRGLVWDGQQLYAIEAPGDSIVQTDAPIIYRLADTFIQPGTMSCGTTSLSGNGAAVFGEVVGELNTAMAQAAGAVSEIDVGGVGDFELSEDFSGDATAAAAAITTRLALVDAIYSSEIGVQINVPFVEVFDDPATPDPFSDTDDPSTLLGDVRNYRQTTPAQNSLGLTHLYTGRVFPSSTVGIAFVNELCNPSAGAGLTAWSSSATFDSLVTAHEMGHNFGAPHDGETGSVCEAEPMTFLMAPMLNNSNQFSDCSKGIMLANAAQAACITALPAVDVSVALNGQASTVLLGTNPSLVFDVRSNGTVQVSDVVADINLPGGLNIDLVSATSGTCTTNTSNVNCTLGDFPGLTLRTVTINTTADTVTPGILNATVTTTDVDERLSNNQYSQQLNVDPAVDLVINTPSTVTVTLDQSATIRATLENRSVLDATGVTLSVSLGPKVQVDSASWTAGTCTVAAQQVDCVAANFANQSSSTLTIGVTGLSTGAQSYTVTMGSVEADADPTNNNVTGTVTVNDPARESSGGAVGLPFIWLLGMAALMRRRRVITA
jgi:hypothetical protein